MTTALCADQVVAAAPTLRPQVAELAGRIVTRLTQSFGRTVSGAAQVVPQRSFTGRVTVRRPALSVDAPAPARLMLSPFQFRLPPPAL